MGRGKVKEEGTLMNAQGEGKTERGKKRNANKRRERKSPKKLER